MRINLSYNRLIFVVQKRKHQNSLEVINCKFKSTELGSQFKRDLFFAKDYSGVLMHKKKVS